MGSPPKQVQSDIAAFKGADLVKIWLAPTALERIKLRDRYTEEYNPKAYLRELRALPELPRSADPIYTLPPGVFKRPRP